MGKRRSQARELRAARKRKARAGGEAFLRACIRAYQDGAQFPDPRDFEIDGVPIRQIPRDERDEIWAQENRPLGLQL